jgi:cellulose synthase/poly-beta-1,6-N-acetylglucosamine synthase-like glycosyltransferase
LAEGVTIALWVIAAALLAPAVVFCLQCWAALLPPSRQKSRDGNTRPRVAVIIPAHDEEPVLDETLIALKSQLAAGDQVIVVADNCNDATADIARAAGDPVRVIERRDQTNLGKGFALTAGIGAIDCGSYDVLMILDADCHLEAGALDALARQVVAENAPAQAIYLMQRSDPPAPRDNVSAWAFMVKNFVRPSGLSRLGMPCQLTGTGMAIPNSAIDKVSLASGNIVEDMQLGLDLALAGYPPRLCPEAHVTGRLPRDGEVALRQRRRWEHGHIRTILTQVPRLLAIGIARARLDVIAMALDLFVPPLSLLLVLMTLATAAAAAMAALSRVSWHPAIALAAGLLALLLTVFVAWIRFGRQCLPP